jgi:DNA-binding winged helix-turn-helix (wHTH) protein
MTCRFGEFELDENARELRLKGIEIPLQPRVFDLLVLLYRNRDRVISKIISATFVLFAASRSCLSGHEQICRRYTDAVRRDTPVPVRSD